MQKAHILLHLESIHCEQNFLTLHTLVGEESSEVGGRMVVRELEGEGEEEVEMEGIERSYLELLGCSGDFLFSSSSSCSSSTTSSSCFPQMLHFGGDSHDQATLSPLSTPTTTTTTTIAHGKNKAKSSSRKVNANGGGRRNTINHDCTNKDTTTSKKPKAQGSTKVRKEKIGDRINALQQLVSPFGKTDTATVLHEALGYIRFLHDQVQVLSTPYMQSGDRHEKSRDLRSRGLCLVPLSCTDETAAEKNGADMWSPAVAGSKH